MGEDVPIRVESGSSVEYHDLGAVSDGWLSLAVAPASCGGQKGGARPWGELFRAGSFSGRVEESSAGTRGMVSDGVTSVSFQTDLSADAAAVVVASLETA